MLLEEVRRFQGVRLIVCILHSTAKQTYELHKRASKAFLSTRYDVIGFGMSVRYGRELLIHDTRCKRKRQHVIQYYKIIR